MATLISSKQIQGVVTASVIQGDFSVGGGGSVNLSAASGVTGSFTGSFIGDGSGIVNIPYTSIVSIPTLVSGSSQIDITQTDGFTSFSSSIATSLSSVDTDDQTLSFNQASKILSIGDGNSVDLSTLGGGGGGGSSIWTISGGVYKVSANLEVTGSITATSFIGSIDYSNLTNVPTLISGSSQITSSLDSRYALSGSSGGGDVTHLNTFTSSIQTEVDAISSATSSYITSIPSGTISGSEQLPSGIVSSSVQVLGGTGILSGSHSDVGSLNTFTSSIQTEVDALSAATGSYLTSQTDSQTLSVSGDQLTITSGNTVTIPTGSELPSGTISGSSQVDFDVVTGGKGILSGSKTNITSLNEYTSSTDTRLSGIDSTTSSLEQRVGQIESNTGSYDDQTVISSLNTFTGSYYNDSASFQTQITTEKGRVDAILTSADADKDSFAEIVTLINQVDTSNDNAFAAHYTSSRQRDTALEAFTSSIQTEVNLISSATSSYLTEVPSGTISSSAQITSVITGGDLDMGGNKVLFGNVYSTEGDLPSASTYHGMFAHVHNTGKAYFAHGGNWIQLVNAGTIISSSKQITDLGFISSSDSTTSLNTFTSSIQTEVDGLSAVTSSYITQLPTGTVSGSIQILGGTGILSGSHTDISSLNTYTSSAKQRLSSIESATGSYLTSETDSQTLSISGDQLTIASGNTVTIPTGSALPSGVISGSSQLTSSYDNRYVINQAPAATFTNHTTNFNTNLATNGKTMVSASVTDTETNTPFSASLSGTNASSFNLVYSNAVSSSIGIHANGNLSAANYSYNVSIFDSIGKFTTYSRTLEVTQADTGTLGGDTTSHIIESAVSGAVIRDATGFGGGNASQVSVSYSPNHGSQAVSTFSSQNPAVGIDNSGNLKIARNLKGSGTGSGDTIVSAITFTDQYGNAGTSNVTVNVFANNHPSASFTDVTGDMNTNEANDGVDLVNVTISDTESDTPFSASLSGTDASSFKIQYNNSNSSSLDIQASGDLASKEYNYGLTVFDNFGKSSSYSRSLIISQSNVGTLGTNGTFYVIESAVNGNNIVTNSNGRTGTQGDLGVTYSPNYGSQVVQEFTSSNALISVSSAGALTVGSNISGSSETSGDTINSNITFADQYGNVGSGSIAVNVTTNNAPDIIFNNSSLLNTNQATGSSGTLTTLSFSDTESDTIDYDGVTFSDSSNQLTFTQNSNTWLVKANSQLSASNYTFSASVDDVHSFRTNTEGHTIAIAQSPTGSLNGDTTMYILESTGSGAPFRDATGYENGNLAQIGVSYSPNHGSAAVKTFSSLNPAITINNSGNLTLGVNLSGSATQSGDTISSVITYTDQYGNVGNQEITATVFGNQSPAASFTKTGGYETDNAVADSDAGALVVTDVESNSPFTITLAGTDGGKFDVSGSTSPFEIQPTGSLVAGTYSINIIVTDTYSESVTLSNQQIAVTQSQDFGKVYIYYSNYGSDAGLGSNYDGVMGISTVNGSTPPEVTAFTGNATSPLRLISSSLGETTLNLAGGANATKAAEVSGSNLNTVISASAAAMSWANGVQTIIIFPSGSDMGGIPTSMTDAFGGSTTGQYVLVEYADGTSAPLGATNSTIHLLDTSGSINGYDKHFVIGAKAQNSATTMRLKVLAVSGSLGAF